MLKEYCKKVNRQESQNEMRIFGLLDLLIPLLQFTYAPTFHFLASPKISTSEQVHRKTRRGSLLPFVSEQPACLRPQQLASKLFLFCFSEKRHYLYCIINLPSLQDTGEECKFVQKTKMITLSYL